MAPANSIVPPRGKDDCLVFGRLITKNPAGSCGPTAFSANGERVLKSAAASFSVFTRSPIAGSFCDSFAQTEQIHLPATPPFWLKNQAEGFGC